MLEPDINKPQAKPRYRGLTEKSRSLLHLLREIPYITLPDIKRFYYPSHKTDGYTLEMLRYLKQNNLVEKYMLGNGKFIYYLTANGRRLLDFYLDETPKYDQKSNSFYYSRPPAKASETNPQFHFPSRNLEFQSFAPHNLANHPFHHTAALLELHTHLRKAYRFFHVLWLDMVLGKKSSLNLSHNPDLLLTNNCGNERGRIFVELENSRIKGSALIKKLDGLTSMPADWYLFVCTSEELFLNLGRQIRKILLGLVKKDRHALFFSPRTHHALIANVLIGHWIPSNKNQGIVQVLKTTPFYRYDAEVFDSTMWVHEVDKNGVIVTDPITKVPRKKEVRNLYAGRRPGEKVFAFQDIVQPYLDEFKGAVRRALNSGSGGKDDG
jgi:DNA-binding PadR family transcriptional regulator